MTLNHTLECLLSILVLKLETLFVLSDINCFPIVRICWLPLFTYFSDVWCNKFLIRIVVIHLIQSGRTLRERNSSLVYFFSHLNCWNRGLFHFHCIFVFELEDAIVIGWWSITGVNLKSIFYIWIIKCWVLTGLVLSFF